MTSVVVSQTLDRTKYLDGSKDNNAIAVVFWLDVFGNAVRAVDDVFLTFYEKPTISFMIQFLNHESKQFWKIAPSQNNFTIAR